MRTVVKPDEPAALAQLTKSVRVLAISGAFREANFTRRALEVALRGASTAGATVDLLDLSRMKLPFCDERTNERSYPRDVHRLRRAAASADGIILGSPEYHGSMSGALKNALDLLTVDELEGKMVGLVAVAGGSQSAMLTLAHLRTVCRHLRAWVVPCQVSISRIADAFTPSGHLRDRNHEARLLEVGRDVARYAALHSGGAGGAAQSLVTRARGSGTPARAPRTR